jgi:ubiquinone/menaquinone biosynthesis C-methylase UbiE
MRIGIAAMRSAHCDGEPSGQEEEPETKLTASSAREQVVPEQESIYKSEAEGYERLIEHEDYQGNLIRALAGIVPMQGKTVLDLGTGTGRFVRALSGSVGKAIAIDISAHMLQFARAMLLQASARSWGLVVGDNRCLPLQSRFADVVIAGWSFGHATVWHRDRWRDEIGACMGEMTRVLRRGGTAIICETLGTGSLEPRAPTPTLADYYHYLESELGFERKQVSTDYKFSSLGEAVETIRFFFGDELAEKVKTNRWSVVPEWTGIWSRTV